MKKSIKKSILWAFLGGVVCCSGLIKETVVATPKAEKETQKKSALPISSISVADPAAPDTQTTKTIEEKRARVVALIERGKDALKERTFDAMTYAINHTDEFKNGELYLYLFDMNTVLVAHGEDCRLTWKDYYDLKDDFGNYAMRGVVQTAQQGGGWYVYRWRNTTKVAYVQLVEKDGKKYAMGCGYYPLAKQEYAYGLVKGAISTFDRLRKLGQRREVVFGSFSYPFGKFVHGDLNLYVLSDKGVALVYGEQFGLIGESLWDYKAPNGEYVYRDAIKALEKKPLGEGLWFESFENGAQKRTYAERIVDEGKSFFIMSGYYPDADQSKAVSLVKKGAAYLEASGADAAARAFTRQALQAESRTNPFRYGDLYLIVYNLDGVCIAHGENRERVGRKELDDLKDADGRLIVKEIIEKAQESKQGWLDFRVKNAFWAIYIERVDVADKQYIVCCGMYPVTKQEMMHIMVRTAEEYFLEHDDHTAYTSFTEANGAFTRGDLEVFVLDSAGLCYVWGLDFKRIWQNYLTYTDQLGKPFVKMMINSVEHGPTTIISREYDAKKMYYAHKVSKNGKTYIIGSCFYP